MVGVRFIFCTALAKALLNLIAGLKHTETDIEEIKRDWMFMLKLTLLMMKTLSLL
jgi:Ca2+/Na+ antiporter